MALDFMEPCHTEHRLLLGHRLIEEEITARQYTFGDSRVIDGEVYEYDSGCLTGNPVHEQLVFWRRVRKLEQLVIPTLCVGESR